MWLKMLFSKLYCLRCDNCIVVYLWHTDFVQDVTILCYCWLHNLNDGRDYQIWCSYPFFSIHIPFCIGVYYGSSFVVKKNNSFNYSI